MTTSRCALIIGAAGQDGSYLADLLLEEGYRVVGVVRGRTTDELPNLEHVRDRIELVAADLADTDALLDAVTTYEPDELYNFASVSFGPDAWDDPVQTVELGGLAIARLLEAPPLDACRSSLLPGVVVVGVRPSRRVSAERADALRSGRAVRRCKGTRRLPDQGVPRASRPLRVLRPLLQPRVTPPSRALCHAQDHTAAASIALGRSDRLVLGDLEPRRDWGFAGDYVRAAWLMLQADEPADFVVATGERTRSVSSQRLRSRRRGSISSGTSSVDSALIRAKGQVADLVGDASAARAALGWSPTMTFDELGEVDGRRRSRRALAQHCVRRLAQRAEVLPAQRQRAWAQEDEQRDVENEAGERGRDSPENERGRNERCDAQATDQRRCCDKPPRRGYECAELGKKRDEHASVEQASAIASPSRSSSVTPSQARGTWSARAPPAIHGNRRVRPATKTNGKVRRRRSTQPSTGSGTR